MPKDGHQATNNEGNENDDQDCAPVGMRCEFVEIIGADFGVFVLGKDIVEPRVLQVFEEVNYFVLAMTLWARGKDEPGDQGGG